MPKYHVDCEIYYEATVLVEVEAEDEEGAFDKVDNEMYATPEQILAALGNGPAILRTVRINPAEPDFLGCPCGAEVSEADADEHVATCPGNPAGN